MQSRWIYLTIAASVSLIGVGLTTASGQPNKANPPANPQPIISPLEWLPPNPAVMMPAHEQIPIYFVNRSQSLAEWQKLPSFWNVVTEKLTDPLTGKQYERKAVKIKVPLGLTRNPPVPAENPMTVQKWELGRELFFDVALSTDSTVSCASCHNAKTAYVDNLPTSVGIGGKVGGMNAPTVINSAYNPLQFWDGRAASLEEQAQGPVTNPVEMFDPRGDKNADAWHQAVLRIRQNPSYTKRFLSVFGTLPTRDAIAKAIATYERTVLAADSLYDRAELAMRERVAEEESNKFVVTAQDYETVLKAALAEKDTASLEAIQFVPAKLSETAKRLANGHALFFGKARCNSCHVGDNFTDNEFHNLGVGVVDGQLQPNHYGRFVRLPTGHKRPDTIGAFKTPTLRSLVTTAPYMHDGSEKTLEDVVEFYDRGGNPNEFLDVKMRDFEAERAYLRDPKGYNGPKVYLFGEAQTPIVPLRLNLTPQEKADLVLFLRALQGRPVDPIVANPTMPIPR